MLKLNFSHGNAKLDKLEKVLGKKVWHFSIMSGHTCPFSKDCLSKAVFNGKSWSIQDGPHTQFRCFSASQEVLFPSLRESRIQNTQLVYLASTNINEAVDTILYQLPKDCEVLRLHIGGDFMTLNYLDAWLSVIRQTPHINYYAYTKSLPLWIKRINQIPQNLQLTASFGGKRDDLIDKYNLRYAKVVYSEPEAEQLGLGIDHNDYHAYSDGPSFALLIHGVQPKNSEAAEALKILNGKGTYSR